MQSLLPFSKTFVCDFIFLLNRKSKLTFFSLFTFLAFWAHGQVSVKTATRGTNISADNAANAASPFFTTLGDISIREANKQEGNFATDVTQLVLHAPGGWTFQTSGVTASVTATGPGTPDITVGTITFTSTAITIPLTVANTNTRDKLTISGVAVRSIDGSIIPNSGDITATFAGTITGLSSTTNVGSLSQVAGTSKFNTTTSLASNTNPSCAGSNITLTATITGGSTATGTVEFFDGANSLGSSNISSNQATLTLSSLSSGSHSLTATYSGDASFNSSTSSALTQNVAAALTILNVTGGGSYCAGGSGVEIDLSGSETGVNYQLQLGGNPVGSTVSGTGSPIGFGLQTAAGAYTVVATNTGCTSTMNGSPTVIINAAAFNVTGGGTTTCVAGIEVGLDGSQAGVSYQLKKNGVNIGQPLTGTGSAISFGQRHQSGTYTVEATDPVAGCINTMTGNAVVTTPDVTITPANKSNCGSAMDNGAITIDVASGGPYEFSINNGSFQGSGSTFTFTNPSLGDNNIQVRNINDPSCIASLGVAIKTLNPVAASLFSTTAAGCNGNLGSLKIDARNGPTPYTFSLTGDATKIQTSNTFAGLNAGTYNVTVTDARGCTATVSNITIAQSAPPTASLFRTTPVSCNGNDGSLIISPDGGVRPYTFDLTGAGTKTQTTNTFTGLAPGTYNVIATDTKGCTATVSGIKIVQPPLVVKFSKANVTCKGGTNGSITGRPEGGVPPYQYSLSGPVNKDFQSSNIFSNLPAGTYTLTVRDSKGCTNAVNVIINDGTVACTATAVTTSSATASIKLNSYKSILKVQAMPNPSITEFALKLQSNNQERVQIIVTDMFGKKLYQTTGSFDQRYTFGKEFRPGTYIVQVIQGKEIQTLKLMKGN